MQRRSPNLVVCEGSVPVCVSAQVKVFVTGLFSLNQDFSAFKEHLRDFLVQIKVSFLPNFNQDLEELQLQQEWNEDSKIWIIMLDI